MKKLTYHSLIIKSDYFIFQEVTKGPFLKKYENSNFGKSI